jgi:hypothetical protein
VFHQIYISVREYVIRQDTYARISANDVYGTAIINDQEIIYSGNQERPSSNQPN